MKPNIFEYLSYRQYLKNRLEYLGAKSGLKRQAAKSLGVHTTFISQVVLGKAELSLDQAERMNSFLQHSEDEGDFFLDLVIYERANEGRLKKRFLEKIQARHTHRSQIKTRLSKTKELAASDQDRFYSSHIYGLLHVLASIPTFQTRKSLIAALGMPAALTNDAIDFLLKAGVLKTQKDSILPGEQHIHLSKESQHLWRHHTNWRLATVQQFAFAEPKDLHYSLAFSCTEQDAQKIRELLLTQLEKITKNVAASREEKAYVYCFDFFQRQ